MVIVLQNVGHNLFFVDKKQTAPVLNLKWPHKFRVFYDWDYKIDRIRIFFRNDDFKVI